MADPSQRAPSPDMLELARAAMARAYAPYSRFAVGAVVRGCYITAERGLLQQLGSHRVLARQTRQKEVQRRGKPHDQQEHPKPPHDIGKLHGAVRGNAFKSSRVAPVPSLPCESRDPFFGAGDSGRVHPG